MGVQSISAAESGHSLYNLAEAFLSDTIECRFLFDEDVVAYFDEVYEKGRDVAVKISRLQKGLFDGNEKENLRDEIVMLSNWFLQQSYKMFTVFRDDLSIKALR
jgi:hypothetical protein